MLEPWMLLCYNAYCRSKSRHIGQGQGRFGRHINKQEKTMKKRTRKGTLRVDTLRWNEYIEM